LTQQRLRLWETGWVPNSSRAAQRAGGGGGLIDAWRVIERSGDGRMVAVEVTLPDWLMRSIVARRVLTLSPDYYRLRSPLARRVYEVARKHCGSQPSWRVSLLTLRAKTGSTATPREFRRLLLAAAGDLPDYRMVIDDGGDIATFCARSEARERITGLTRRQACPARAACG